MSENILAMSLTKMDLHVLGILVDQQLPNIKAKFIWFQFIVVAEVHAYIQMETGV
jgi:hypothetical protein